MVYQKESENLFRKIFETAGIAIIVVEEDNTISFANNKMEELSGYSKEELEGKKRWTEFVSKKDLDGTMYYHKLRLENKPESVDSLNIRIVDKNGNEKHVICMANAIPGGSRSAVSMVGITARKQMGLALEDSERKYKDILSTIVEGYYETDLLGNFVFFNDSLCVILGYEREELMGLGYKSFYTNPEEVFDTYNRVYHTGKPEKAVGWPVLTKDGRKVFLEVSVSLYKDSEGVPLGFRGVARDITNRKIAEKQLQESEDKFRILAESSPFAIMIYQDDYYVYVNPAGEEITGYSKEELYNKRFWEIVHPDYQSLARDRGQRRQSGEAAPSLYDLKLFTRNREEKWCTLTGSTTYYNGKTAGFISIIDTTARKEMEEALKESEKRYREILTTMQEGYYEVDLVGNITFCNRSAARLMGYEHDEFVGLNFKKVCNNTDAVFRKFNRVFKSGQPEYALTMEMIRKDGSIGYGEFSVTPIKGKEGYIEGFRGIVRDITERRRFEEQLKYISLHDQLTDLYNRAYFENELDRLSSSREYPITIISADLDGLKLVNDTLGHDQGDELLASCAGVLQNSIRTSDIIARVGGDEFAAILPRTDKKVGEVIVNRIHSGIEHFNSEFKERLPLSVSIGFATADDTNRSLKETFKEADDLMYRDKLRKGIDARSQIIKALTATLGERDFITEGHTLRLEELCLKVGKKISLSRKQLSNLALLAQVHDIGKVGIPDRILFKEGPLTNEEWKTMRQHAEKGYRIALSSTDLSGIADLILKHHEWWDGSGYPMGIKEKEIPVECRILAIADAYDAMTNHRPYRKAMSKEEAVAELKRCAGSQFDLQLVEVFLSIL